MPQTKCPTCNALIDLVKSARKSCLIFECGRCDELEAVCRGLRLHHTYLCKWPDGAQREVRLVNVLKKTATVTWDEPVACRDKAVTPCREDVPRSWLFFVHTGSRIHEKDN